MKGKWFVATSLIVIIIVALFVAIPPKRKSSTLTKSTSSAGSSEVILKKINSSGFYKVTEDHVAELWDDKTMADKYPIKGTYHSVSTFNNAFPGYSLINPLKNLDFNKISGMIIFGPINYDFDETRGVEYSVYGLLIWSNNGIEYYMNTFGKSKVFTYIQDLRPLSK